MRCEVSSRRDLQLQFSYRFMFFLAKIPVGSKPDIKVSAVRPDLHIEIITGGKGAVVGKEEEEVGEGEILNVGVEVCRQRLQCSSAACSSVQD